MSRPITFSVTRSGVAVASLSRVRGRLDNISLAVVAGSGGAVPYNSYTFISTGRGVPDIRQGDQLTEVNGTKYRASGEPEPCDNDHLEIQITRIVGSTP